MGLSLRGCVQVVRASQPKVATNSRRASAVPAHRHTSTPWAAPASIVLTPHVLLLARWRPPEMRADSVAGVMVLPCRTLAPELAVRYACAMMGSPEQKTLSVLPLDPGKSGLLDGFAQYLGSCAAVCLEKNTHSSGVEMAVEGDHNAAYCLSWQQLTEKDHHTCADLQEATEYGAYGIAILVVRDTAGKTVVERSAKGPGFDFWIGDEEDAELPFQGLARLEVSGILDGHAAAIRARTGVKKKQVTPSDKLAPALIAVVEFGRPVTRLESK